MNQIKKITLTAQAAAEMVTYFEKLLLDPGKFQTEFEAFKVMAGTIAGPELAGHLNLSKADMEKYFAEMRTKFSEIAQEETNKAFAKADAVQTDHVGFLAWAKADQADTERKLNDHYLQSRTSAAKVYPELLEYMDRSHQGMIDRSREMHEFVLKYRQTRYESKLRSYFPFVSDKTMAELLELYAVDVEVD